MGISFQFNFVFLVFSLLIVSPVFSQPFQMVPPLDPPLFLSGNYGELRSTHFHAGIDIKTNGSIGKPVYAVQSGYVSRLKVQSGGYGHAVYITHSNGYTSVYAHMEEFYPELESYLQNEQYRRKSYEIDLTLSENLFVVKQGQKIGLSGNTGRSGGPHLHFELRDSRQVPMNGLKFNLPVKDSISPVFLRLAVYSQLDTLTYIPADKRMYSVTGSNGAYFTSGTIKIGNPSAFGVEVYDYLNGSSNKCGIYELEFLLDDTLIYSFTVDKISFDESRYVKSHLDYAEKMLNDRYVHRLFAEPNNQLSIYNTIRDGGIVKLSKGRTYKAKVRVTDVFQNKSELNFSLMLTENIPNTPSDTGNVYVPCKQEKTYKDKYFSIKFPSSSLFSDKWVSFVSIPYPDLSYSDIVVVGDELVPLNRQAELSIVVTRPLMALLPEKLLLAQINEKGELETAGGRYLSGSVIASIDKFGKYIVVCDTLAPEIIPLSFTNGGNYKAGDILSFKISDELSGIKTYNAYVDGNWVLFRFDAKTGTFSCKLDKNRILSLSGLHKLEIYVLDERNNLAKYSASFYF